jgi:nucleoside-diphosphate-sugar epimerase
MKKVLVTGSEGYIGQHLVELLLRNKIEVIGVDLCWYDKAFVQPKVEGYKLLNLDFDNLTKDQLNGVDAVCHLAAISNDPMGDLDPTITLVTNNQKTITFAEKCHSWGVKQFIFSSSCSVYGEAVEDIVNENSVLNPVSLYAETKCSVEKALTELNSDSFSTTSLRNATAYGHSTNLRLDLVINDFVSSAYTTGCIKMLSDGQAHRPLIHCRDIAHAFVATIEGNADDVNGRIVNVGPQDANLKVADMACMVQSEFENCKLEIGEGAGKDSRDYAVDFSLFSEIFPNFNFEYDLKNGIRELHNSLKNINFSNLDQVDGRFKRLHLLRKALSL